MAPKKKISNIIHLFVDFPKSSQFSSIVDFSRYRFEEVFDTLRDRPTIFSKGMELPLNVLCIKMMSQKEVYAKVVNMNIFFFNFSNQMLLNICICFRSKTSSFIINHKERFKVDLLTNIILKIVHPLSRFLDPPN